MARRVALLALALLGSASAKKSSAVVVIDSQASFSAAVAAHDFLVAEFYAPVRCPVCGSVAAGATQRLGAVALCGLSLAQAQLSLSAQRAQVSRRRVRWLAALDRRGW